ncbi:MAG: cysteine hydrolase [Bacteroidetes bacterium]|nr:cysteine hydrolase [Bacteroidota bacterium]
MEKFALVTNDLQFAAANKHPDRIESVKKFLPIQIKILNQLRTLKIPIIHLQLIVSEDDPRSKGIPDEQKFTKGSNGAQILDEVYDVSDMIIEKPKDSGFFETSLDATLKELGITHLIITGMQTQICVQTTAADAYFRGFKVYVPSDAVISTRIEDTQRSLEWMGNYCAIVKTSDEIITIVKNSQINN